MGLRDALGGLLGGGEEPPVESVEDPAEPPIPVDDIREVADDAADARAELDLDFSLSSLDRLDEAAAKRDMDFDDPGDADALVEREEVLVLGAYFGETLIRQFGGAWEYAGGWSVHLAPDDDVVEVPAFEVAARSLSGEPTFSRVADSAATELDGDDDDTDAATDANAATVADDDRADAAVTDDDRVSETGGAAGGGAIAADDVPADADLTPVRGPEPVADGTVGDPLGAAERYREAAEKLVASWPDYDLDGSVVSLAHLDDLVDAAGDDAADSASLDALAGYFAEVLRREHDAVWERRDGAPVLVLSGPAGEAELDPYSLAADALAGEASFVERYAEAAASCGIGPPAQG